MPKKKQGKRSIEGTSDESIRDCISSVCCQKNCLKKLSYEFTKDLREEYYSMLQSEQSKKLATILENRVGRGRYMVNGKEVCRNSLHSLFNTHEKRLCLIQRSLDSGIKDFERSNKEEPKANENMDLFYAFMKEFLDNCEPIPNKDGHFQAPLAYSKKMLFDLAIERLEEKAPKKSTFYSSLSECYHYLQFPRDFAFAKCSVCVSLKTQKKSTNNRALKEAINAKLHAHYEVQRKERLEYANKIQLARLNPCSYLMVAIDEMDQMKTRIIKLYPIPKNFDTKKQLPVHVTGVKVHGEVEEAFIYLDVNQVIFLFNLFFFFFFLFCCLLFFGFSYFWMRLFDDVFEVIKTENNTRIQLLGYTWENLINIIVRMANQEEWNLNALKYVNVHHMRHASKEVSVFIFSIRVVELEKKISSHGESASDFF